MPEKQQVVYQCGHSGTIPLKMTEQWIERLQAGDCPNCWLQKQPPVFRISSDSSRVLVCRGYSIRAQLKERNYWFRRPHWSKRFATESEREEEIRWIRDSGFGLEGTEI